MARIMIIQQRKQVIVRIVRGLPGAAGGGGGGGGEVTKAELEAERARAEAAEKAKLAKASNLGDVESASVSRTNLGLGSAATQNSTAFDAAGAATTAETNSKTYTDTAKASLKTEITTEKERAEGAENGKLAKAENLKDLPSPATARTSLGLGSAATQNSSAFDTAGAATTAETNAVATAKAEVKVERERAEAKEAESVKLTGVQTIAGVKTFSSPPTIPAPVAATDAATKEYVDSVAQGASPKESVILASFEALPANTYAAGVITGTANGALSVDSTAVAVGQRILIKNEAAEEKNGIYVVTAAGGAAEKFVLTRSKDLEKGTQVPGAYVFVETGTENKNGGFIVVGKGPFVIGTTAIKWTQFTGAGEITAGTGLTKAGNTLSVTNNTYEPFGTDLKKAENLKDLENVATARTNLGLGTAATASASEFAPATATTTALGEKLAKAENLKDVSNADSSRANLKVLTLQAAACVATANVAAKEGLKEFDGYTLVDNDIVLLTNQSVEKENGPWVAHAGAWIRPKDFEEGAEVRARVIPVINGTKYKFSWWLLNSNSTLKIGTDNLKWVVMTQKKTLRETQAWVWRREELVVAETVDGTEFSPGENEEIKLCRLSYKIASGTSIEFKVQRKNGAGVAEDITGFGTTASPLKAESTTAAVAEPTAVKLNAGDELLLVIIKNNGTAKGLVVRPFVEHI